MSLTTQILLSFGLMLSTTVLLAAQNSPPAAQNPTPVQSPELPKQPGANTSSSPSVSFLDPTVRLLSGSQDGTSEISLKSSSALTAAPVITDVALPHPPAAGVEFGDPVKDGNSSLNIWRYRVKVSGLTPANASQQRYANVIVGEGKPPVTIAYVLTNQPAASFSWTISKLSDPWVVSSWAGACTSFLVTPKDSPATSVSINSTLVEQSTKQAITIADLKVCLASTDCNGPIDLPANVPSQLRLCTSDGFHGNFHGLVTLAALQKPDGEIILQNAQFSSFYAKLGGFILILLGVVIAWLSKVWSRSRLERNQALIPAILMRSQLENLQGLIENFPADYRALPVKTKNAINALLNELSDKTLDQKQFIAPKFPNPFGTNTDSVGYKTYLEERNSKIQFVAVLVKNGLVRAVAEHDDKLTTAKKDFIKAAIQQIDQISEALPQPSLDQAKAQLDAVITKLKNEITGLTAAPENSTPSAREFETVQLEIQAISKWVWVIYGVLTALTGLGVLILNNPGFGVPLDFLFAFFWGFGLPTTIQALAPGSVATALNISVPRS